MGIEYQMMQVYSNLVQNDPAIGRNVRKQNTAEQKEIKTKK